MKSTIGNHFKEREKIHHYIYCYSFPSLLYIPHLLLNHTRIYKVWSNHIKEPLTYINVIIVLCFFIFLFFFIFIFFYSFFIFYFLFFYFLFYFDLCLIKFVILKISFCRHNCRKKILKFIKRADLRHWSLLLFFSFYKVFGPYSFYSLQLRIHQFQIIINFGYYSLLTIPSSIFSFKND